MHPRCISDRSQRDPRSIPHPSHVHPTSLPDPSSPKGACLPSRQVGYWYVESLDDGWCRVYYSTDSVLPTWIPGAGHSVAYVHQPMCISLCACQFVCVRTSCSDSVSVPGPSVACAVVAVGCVGGMSWLSQSQPSRSR